MKNKILNLIFFLLFLNLGFSQENYNWNDIQKTELFSFSENEYCENIKTEDLTAEFLIPIKKGDFIKSLVELKEPEFDLLLEKQCLILRVYFLNSTKDFIIYREQGILIDLNNQNISFQLENKSEFNKLLKKYIN